jgi:hypothetical protein
VAKPGLDLDQARRDLALLPAEEWAAQYGERLVAHLEASRAHRVAAARNLLRALGAVRVAYDAMVQLRTVLAAYHVTGAPGKGPEARRILAGQTLARRVSTIAAAFALRANEALSGASPAAGSKLPDLKDLDRASEQVKAQLDALDPEREPEN